MCDSAAQSSHTEHFVRNKFDEGRGTDNGKWQHYIWSVIGAKRSKTHPRILPFQRLVLQSRFHAQIPMRYIKQWHVSIRFFKLFHSLFAMNDRKYLTAAGKVLLWSLALIPLMSNVPRMRVIVYKGSSFRPDTDIKSSTTELFHCVHSAARQLSKLYCKHCVLTFGLSIMPLYTQHGSYGVEPWQWFHVHAGKSHRLSPNYPMTTRSMGFSLRNDCHFILPWPSSLAVNGLTSPPPLQSDPPIRVNGRTCCSLAASTSETMRLWVKQILQIQLDTTILSPPGDPGLSQTWWILLKHPQSCERYYANNYMICWLRCSDCILL